jgi:hypothetical protein
MADAFTSHVGGENVGEPGNCQSDCGKQGSGEVTHFHPSAEEVTPVSDAWAP